MTTSRWIALAGLALGACDDTTPAWELHNDRIIAVRATPPHVRAGETAVLDVLVTTPIAGPRVIGPIGAAVSPVTAEGTAMPAELAGAVRLDGGGWVVHAPDDATLTAVRPAMGLAPADPVPLLVAIAVDLGAGPVTAVKTVYLGDAGDNPALGAVTIGGAEVTDGMAVPVTGEVALHVDASEDAHVDWLTSIGELADADDADATLLPDVDAPPGHVAVVVRDRNGGVAWAYWSIRVAP